MRTAIRSVWAERSSAAASGDTPKHWPSPARSPLNTEPRPARGGLSEASTIACVKLEVRLGDLRDVDGAAQVWARATAKREGTREIPPLEAAKQTTALQPPTHRKARG